MNKIIRFASVIALACASLVYVGCTKDFSGDVNRLENQDQAITQQVQSLEKSLADFKTTAMNAIDANKAELGAKYDELKAAISGLQTTDANLDKAIGEVSASVNSALASIAKLETTDAALKASIEALEKAVKDNKAACDAQVEALKGELAQLLAAFGASSEEIEAVLARLDAENKYASSQIVELQEELQYQVSGILTELALQKSLLEAAASGVAANADAIKLNKEDIDVLFGKVNANTTHFTEWCNTLAEEIWANHEEIEALFIKANATQADLDDFKNMIAEEIFRQSEEIETLFGKTAANYDFFSDWCEQIGAQASVNAEEIENLFAKVNALGQDLEDWKSQLAEQIGVNMEKIETLFDKTNANYAYFSDWCEQLAGEVQSVKNELDTLASKVLVENEGLATAIKTLKTETNAAIGATNAKITAILGSIEEINTKLDGVLASIVTIQKQIGGLQARITSIVAVPSVVPELTGYYIEGHVLDTAVFTTTFLVNPIAAAEQLTAEDLTLYVKEGLAKGQTPIDEEYDVEVLSIKNGKVTVKAVVTNKLAPTYVGHKLYYALSFVGKDSADSTYEVVSRFEPAVYGDYINLKNTVELYNGTTKVTAALADSIKYNDLTTEVTAYPATLAPVYVLGDSLYTPDQLAAYFHLSDAAKAKVQFVDTNYVNYTQGQTATKDPAQSFIVDTTAAKVKVAAAHGTAVGNVVVFEKKYVIAGMAEGATLGETSAAQKLISTVKISPIEYTITLPTLTTKWTWKADTTYTTKFEGTDAASITKLIAGGVAVNFDSTWFSVNTTAKPDSIILAAANPYIVNAAKTAAVQAKPVADSVSFIINGEVVLPVQPADITVNLGSCDTVVTDFTQTIIIPNDNFGLFYAEIADKIEIAQADTADFWAVVDGNFPASTSTVKYNEESVSGTSYIHFGLGQIIVKEDVLANGYGTYVLTRETEVNGVKITFNYTINVKQADVALTVVDPYVKVKNGVNYIEVKGYKGLEYHLNVLPMNTYFRVEGDDVAETSALPYTISYAFPESFTTTLGAPAKYEYDPNGKMISDHELDFAGYQNDTLVVKTYLNNNVGVAVDSLELVFWTKDPIPTFVSTYRTIKVRADGEPTTEYLFAAQSNPSTADLLFTPIYALDLDGQFVNFNDNIFDATLIFGAKETWTVNGEPVPATILDLITLDEVNGRVTVAANQATWEKPIVISVPVALGYMLGGVKEGSVQLRISK